MQVKNLVPTLQILDGHPLVPGKVKRRYEGKRVFSRGGDESVVEEKETQAKKKKKSSGEKPKEVQQDEEDAPEKPFVELIIKAQPAIAAEVKKVTDVRQESGVVAVIDGKKKETGGIWRRKQGIAALAALKEPEIGTGGPSSWDAPVEPPAAVPVAAKQAPTTTYSRWALKKK